MIPEIQTAFDENPTANVRGVFLDIYKAFNKVWHDSLLYKLKAYGVQVELLSILNDQISEWRQIICGVPRSA